MIELVDVHKSFGEQKVLKGISAKFEPGKTSLIIGKSGAGKSVLLKCMVGLFEPTDGEILYNDRAFHKLSEDEKREIRTELGMLFQGTALFDSMTVEQNIKFPLDMFSNMSNAEKLDRVNFCLKRVNLENVNHKYPSEISGGMQKRVGIARAIVLNPKYLFCDEPNSGLDPQTSMVIDDLIKELTEEYNMTTVINTHDMNSVTSIGDYVLFLHQGYKNWEGDRNQIFTTDNQEVTDFIFASEFLKQVRKLHKV
ncbi:MAG: ATP-binding cassette domain-containing protein [Saprospiraceae bacterium]|nr:ATP-binding cassette domain-containing protein [Saprospiraceae bacterium]